MLLKGLKHILGFGAVLILTMAYCQPRVSPPKDSSFLVVLGIAQDAGYPQAQCTKDCCRAIWGQPEKYQKTSCLALVDLALGKYWLFDATPDFKTQIHVVESNWAVKLSGIFLTHAHVGHYTGLIHLGREGIGSKQVPVYALPRMKGFLAANGPWDQLVKLGNIQLVNLNADSSVMLSPKVSVTPFLVPHRDEYSETAGFKISGSVSDALFIPDIDKWNKWDRELSHEITMVDLAFIDGSFFRDGELKGRNMNSIPHPFVVESMTLLRDINLHEKGKVHFIHFNHTNPLLQPGHERDSVLQKGFNLAQEGDIFPL